MDILNVVSFLQTYSLQATIISIVVAIICLVVDKFLAEKLCITVKVYAPFIVGTILQFLYDVIFVKGFFIPDENTVYAGVLCGSLGTAIFATVKRIITRKPITEDKKVLAIEGLIHTIIKSENLSTTAKEIVFLYQTDTDTDDLVYKIKLILDENSIEGISITDLDVVANACMEALKSLAFEK